MIGWKRRKVEYRWREGEEHRKKDIQKMQVNFSGLYYGKWWKLDWCPGSWASKHSF